MKKTLPFLVVAIVTSFITGCSAEREVQMDLTDVQLVKVDTIQRYPYASEKLLTWRGEDQVSYVTFVPIETYYPIGARMKVMVKR